MLDINLKSCIQENREKLSPISDTIKLCGRLGLGSYFSGQVGNFIEFY